MLHRPEMKTLFSILLLAVASIHCAVGNEADFNPADLPCSKVGFFPVTGSCQDYYECKVWEDGFVPVHARCPPGRIFDDIVAECLPKSYVTSPAHCLSDAAAPEDVVVDAAAPGIVVIDDSAPGVAVVNVVEGSITDDAASGVVDVNEEDVSGNLTSPVTAETLPGNVTAEVGEVPAVPAGGSTTENGTGVLEDNTGVADGGNITLSKETIEADDAETIVPAEEMTICDHMGIVDTYATLIISSPLLEESFEYQEKYNKNIMKYNRHLEKAQNDSLIWRNGESILTGIKRTYAQASAYEVEFNRKYEIYQDRIKTVSKQNNDNNERFTRKLKDDIKKLQEEIKGNEQVLSMTDVPQVKIYFENNIVSKRQEIERKQQEIKANTNAGLQLVELLQFLEYVKHDANEVEVLARHSRDRMEMFRQNLEDDYIPFEKYATVVKEDIRALTEEKEQYQQNLAANEAEQLRLEDQKDEMDTEINQYNDANENNRKNIHKITKKMERKTNKFHRQRTMLCREDGKITFFLEANASAIEKAQACNDLLESENVTLDLSEERVKLRQLTEESQRNREQINAILSEITVINQQITDLLSVIPTYGKRLRQIDVELGSFQMYDSDLENLKHGINSAMDSLLNIMKEFEEMQSSFEFITKQFNVMIAQGNAAENDEARRHEKLAIEQHISVIPEQLAQLMLPDLVKCT